jgi:hypothetical protein
MATEIMGGAVVAVDEVRPVGRPDEGGWQLADVDVSLGMPGAYRTLVSVTLRAGAYLDGTEDDGQWCQAQDGSRALVSLLTGRAEPVSECGAWPVLQAAYAVCDQIGREIGAAIREAVRR